MSNEAVSVAIVEDDPACRARFADALTMQGQCRLVGSFSNGASALAWLDQHQPDVLLTDLGLPDIPGLAVIAYCAQRHPRCGIMVITMYEDEEHVVKSLEVGASGYLLKDSLRGEIVQHVMDLHAGGSPITPAIARHLLKRFRMTPATAPACAPADICHPLTARELEILALIAKGFSYAEVAAVSGISPHTVHAHIKHIYSKLQVNSRSEAVFEAAQMGLLDADFRPSQR